VLRRLRPVAYDGLSCIFVFALAVGFVKVASEWLAATEGISDAAARAEEIGRARTTVLAVLAGGLAAIGAYYTHRSYALSRQGQITERFTRAVDQLGNPESLDVRLGGIYALERLARESREDHGPIVEILTAYVREHAPAIPEDVEQELIEHAPDEYPKPPEADVQAALTVLGRRNDEHDPPAPWHLDLRGAYLPRANLRGAKFARADLSYAVLEQAALRGIDLWDAHLVGARLFEADFSHAHLGQADLRGARMNRAVLVSARMPGARLVAASLGRARLREARLQGADLTDANLERADLIEANLEGATLIEANMTRALVSRTRFAKAELSGVVLEEARYSRGTIWPDGFDPGTSNATLVRGE
jgi:hypothetical protein